MRLKTIILSFVHNNGCMASIHEGMPASIHASYPESLNGLHEPNLSINLNHDLGNVFVLRRVVSFGNEEETRGRNKEKKEKKVKEKKEEGR